MSFAFITIRFFDLIDILLFAVLLYQLFMLIRGSAAINIFIGVIFIYLFWLLVKAFNMQLLSNFLGQVIGVGTIAIIIVFQQEIRRFLLLIGSRYFRKRFSAFNFLNLRENTANQLNVPELIKACVNMTRSKTGALFVIQRISSIDLYAETGVVINGELSAPLIESVFFENSPLHDGAMIIIPNRVHAARCILPVSQSKELPANLGMRHRSALGITEQNDAFVIILSEETGEISYAEYAKMTFKISIADLQKKLEAEFTTIN